MYKSFFVCCCLLASLIAPGAKATEHRPERDERPVKPLGVASGVSDQRKALRAVLVAQKDTPGRPETIPATARQLTLPERALLREQLRHQIPQLP